MPNSKKILPRILDKHANSSADHVTMFRDCMLSASKGNIDEQFSVGFMHEYGKGTEPNLVHGHMWYSIAAAEGDERSVEAKADIEKYMNDEEIAESKKLASKFVVVKDEWK